jgi:hypothetical protein
MSSALKYDFVAFDADQRCGRYAFTLRVSEHGSHDSGRGLEESILDDGIGAIWRQIVGVDLGARIEVIEIPRIMFHE